MSAEFDPDGLVIDAGDPVPNGGRLNDEEHPPAPLVAEPAAAGCGCDEGDAR